MKRFLYIILFMIIPISVASSQVIGNTYGADVGSTFVFNTVDDSFPFNGMCLSWYGGRASACSSQRAEYVVGRPTSLREVRFTRARTSAGSSCTIKAMVRKSGSASDTDIGTITLTNKGTGGSVYGLPYTLSPGDRLKIMVGEDRSSTGCQSLDGSLFVEMSK